MSKIGKQPVGLSEGVEAKIDGNIILVSGLKGNLSFKIPGDIAVEVKDRQVVVSPKGSSKATRAKFGTVRAIIANMATGVTKGFSRELELVGTGYRAEVNGKTLVLAIGFSHPVKIEAPEGISFKVEKSIVTVEGIDKELVGQVAANIRGVRPPEPYKGKGIKYRDEVVRRKAGKAAKAVGAPA